MVNMVEFSSLWNDNWSLIDIAKHFGVSTRTIQYLVSKEGLQSRFDFWKRNDQHLRDMWPHHSGSEIAAIIGTTRSAVIGRANRLGLGGKRNTGGGRPRTADPSKKRIRLPSKLVRIRPPMILEPAPNLSDLIELIDLEKHHCRFPIHGKYCGNKIVHRAYCGFHARKCYVAPSRGGTGFLAALAESVVSHREVIHDGPESL